MLLKKKEAKFIPEQHMYWGYLHQNGTVQVKGYYEYGQIKDAEESGFVQYIVKPFKTSTRKEALIIITKEIEDVKRMQ
jgi:AmiR/NasT family two-component response regulator